MATILLSRLSGLVRDVVIAAVFGQGRHTDTYYAALQIPDLLFFLIAGGALSSSFMPVYIEYRAQQGEDEAWRLFSVVATLWTTFVLVLVALGELLAPWLVPVLAAPGFPPAELAQVVVLTRIALPAQIAFFTGGLLMGVQWAHGGFLVPGLGPTVYNLGIMAGGALGGLTLGPRAGVAGLVWGALGGALVGNLLLQIYGLWRYQPRFRPTFDLRHPGARRVLWLMLPVIFSLSLPNVDVQVNRWFASHLFPGAMSALERANRLMLVPVGLFGQAVSVGFYASLSQLAVARQFDEFRATVVYGLRLLACLALPATAFLVVCGEPTVALLFQHGRFSAEDTRLVAGALAVYSLGIWCWCSEQLCARAFYALQDTRTPVWTGTGVTVVFVGLNYALWKLFERLWGPSAAHLGLACSTTLSALLYVVLLLVLLRRRVGGLHLVQLGATAAKALVAALALGLVGWAVRRAGLSPLATVALAGGLGLTVFGAVALALGLEEVRAATALVRQKLGR
jgi:putative peptidoglycan lipid II flippase